MDYWKNQGQDEILHSIYPGFNATNFNMILNQITCSNQWDSIRPEREKESVWWSNAWETSHD